MLSILEEADRILLQRTEVYGDASPSNENLGLIWTGILQQHYGIVLPYPIPAHVVLLMQSGIKLSRCVTPSSSKRDDYVDNLNYIRLAHWALMKGSINGDEGDSDIVDQRSDTNDDIDLGVVPAQ